MAFVYRESWRNSYLIYPREEKKKKIINFDSNSWLDNLGEMWQYLPSYCCWIGISNMLLYAFSLKFRSSPFVRPQVMDKSDNKRMLVNIARRSFFFLSLARSDFLPSFPFHSLRCWWLRFLISTMNHKCEVWKWKKKRRKFVYLILYGFFLSLQWCVFSHSLFGRRWWSCAKKRRK